MDSSQISSVCEHTIIGLQDNEEGNLVIRVLGISDKEKLDEQGRITDDIVLWEYFMTLDVGKEGNEDSISQAQMTPDNNVVVEMVGDLILLNGDTGDIIWRQSVGYDADIEVASSGMIYVTTYDQNFLTCYAPPGGEVVWSIPKSESLFKAEFIKIENNELYVDYADYTMTIVYDFEGNYLRHARGGDESMDYPNATSNNNLGGQLIEAVFVDPGFEKAIRDYYGYGDGVILVSELESQEELILKDSPPYKNDIKSIDDLSMFKNLKSFNLTGSDEHTLDINSDTSMFKALTMLEYISMNGTTLSGDIANIKAYNLERLYLEATEVSGDIAHLSNFDKLRNVGLSSSYVTGDIVSLSEMTNIESLYLHYTEVMGDVSSLADMTNLKKLWVYDSLISGKASSLDHLQLESFEHSNSGVN